MPGWAWAIIVVAAVVLVAIVVWRALAAKKTRALQGRFGPEYDRALDSSESRRQAEADLKARAERRDELDIRPLAPGARERYSVESPRVQARFSDDPGGAVRESDMLIQEVISDQIYPGDPREHR